MTSQYTRRGIGFFSEEKQAEQAIRALQSSGFPMGQISILAKQLAEDVVAGGAKTGSEVKGQDINDSKRLPENALAGGFWGGLLGGLSGIAMIPGAGAVIAAGSVGAALAAIAAGQGAGALATSNLKDKLVSLGIPQDRAGAFSDRLINADFMVIADGSQAQVSQAESVLAEHGIQAWDVYGIPPA
ncbi:hypothetical protein PGN35_006550 [Nodosilinea sp. PGN35]|uniref:hypothetical protein n=1 Tax=Nodosilinea sp. PGN35 TaxID=3020489 RepID=UPI0023B2C955|nr:hypothetical protein [Nodosilinea sp. TSF1-S3]MDF0366040.1 hypothetical protein [Nodosilinea sp. TSF1-S3]